MMDSGSGEQPDDPLRQLVRGSQTVARVAEFWRRSGLIYVGFKRVQLENSVLRRDEESQRRRWVEHHEWAAQNMYKLCVDMRGFFLKAGQFLGMRDDFFPKAYVELLSTLQDRVPPMLESTARRAIEAELGGESTDRVFSSIDFATPLGSGTIAQVHQGVLARDGQKVAVKIQYPNAEGQMKEDLGRLRLLASFLQRTELKFDIVTAVDELATELQKEFDFHREAGALEHIGANLRRRRVRGVELPKPISELTTRRMLVMTFVEGTPLSQLGSKLGNLSDHRRKRVCRRLLEAISDVYGGMILLDGLFQADPHPGNVIVKRDLSIGIIDFGQWKTLRASERSGLGNLMTNMSHRDSAGTITAMNNLGIRTKRIADPLLNSQERHGRTLLPEEKLAHTMFDTRTVDGAPNSPFSPDSAIKQVQVETFPKDLFFVLRTVQIIRGMTHGMEVPDFSLCDRWAKTATKAAARTKT